jgi:molecular chaperone GrpE
MTSQDRPDDLEAGLADAYATRIETAAEEGNEAALKAEADAEAVAVEADLDTARLAAERDEYLDALRRLQADFENYKKRMVRQQTEHLERAAETLVVKLLPVLDNFDLAINHGADDLLPIYKGLLDTLASEGLERLDPVGSAFDPTEHDAVAHEAGEGEPEVTEVMRAGYRWKGRVLRPAMVKVRG